MYSKVVLVLAATALAAVSAEYGHSSQHFTKHDGHHQLVHIAEHGHDGHHHGHHEHHHVDYYCHGGQNSDQCGYAHPKYEFKYEVKDPHTGDHKEHHEHRDGDSVKGHYSFHEPDGSIRHVHYHADKKTGFHAEVTHEHHYHH